MPNISISYIYFFKYNQRKNKIFQIIYFVFFCRSIDNFQEELLTLQSIK